MPVQPSDQQIECCALMGWEYLGDGIFARGGQLGWFESSGFVKG